MVDLQSQYQNKNEVDEKVLNVMQSAMFINGPEVQKKKELENYLDIKHVIPCTKRNRCFGKLR